MEERHEKIGPAGRRHRPHPGGNILLPPRIIQQVEEWQQLRGGEAADQQHDQPGPQNDFAARKFAVDEFRQVQHPEQHPRQQHGLRPAGKHLQCAGTGGQRDGSSALAPGAFGEPHHPRHPAQTRNRRRPDETVEHESVEGKDDAGKGGGQPVVRPALREDKHSQTAPKQMQQTEHTQRPGQRQQQIKQRRRIQDLCVPLRQKRRATIVQRIPQRDFTVPEAFAEMIRRSGRKKCRNPGK